MIMLTFPAALNILINIEPIDMRRGIDGLTVLITDQLQSNPQDKTLYLFCNRSRNKVKGLYWEKTALC